jgi:hypothetical protein
MFRTERSGDNAYFRKTVCAPSGAQVGSRRASIDVTCEPARGPPIYGDSRRGEHEDTGQLKQRSHIPYTNNKVDSYIPGWLWLWLLLRLRRDHALRKLECKYDPTMPSASSSLLVLSIERPGTSAGTLDREACRSCKACRSCISMTVGERK